MGIFSNLFGTSSGIEKQLEDIYVSKIQEVAGMPLSQTKSAFRDLLKKAKEDSLKEGTCNLPQNYGDILLEKELAEEKIKSELAKKRKEGVRDEDIKWWWNMHDIERRMLLAFDTWVAFSLFLKLREEDGVSAEKAGKRVRKIHPLFGDPDDTTHGVGEDRPLPYELKDRINIYIQKRSQADPKNFKREIEASSTFNSLVRKEIKAGNI